ncbi:MAG: FkbM family methyltransferase [Anaerolineales bacterium]
MKSKIKNILRACIQFTKDVSVGLGVGVTRLLPIRFWLRVREEAQLVHQMDYPRAPIQIVVDSWIEKDVRLHSCAREPGTVAWIEEWFKPGDVFYDIGANVGAYSLVAFRFLNGMSKIYAFEPGFKTFPQLCKNIQLNDAEKVIFPLQLALSDQTTMTTFHYQNLLTGGALHALGDPVDQHGDQFQPVFSLPTLSYRLDDLVPQFGLPAPNHIKIDVDGTEYQILKGAESLLRNSDLRSILLELEEGQQDANRIEEFLIQTGLMLHSRRTVNLLFCRGSLKD